MPSRKGDFKLSKEHILQYAQNVCRTITTSLNASLILLLQDGHKELEKITISGRFARFTLTNAPQGVVIHIGVLTHQLLMRNS